MRSEADTRTGFTLIELLVVIAVIAILTSMVMMLKSSASQKAAYAKAVKDLEHIDHWLEEYYAQYGHYPNTSGMAWEDPNRDDKPPDWPALKAAIPGLNENRPHGLWKWIYQHQGGRYKEYAEKIHESDSIPEYELDTEKLNLEYGIVYWSNLIETVKDPWGRDYGYQPAGDLQSYNTWSAGPDGALGTADDVSYSDFTK